MISLNKVIINPTMFPDNTSQIWKIPKEAFGPRALVSWDFDNEGEFLQLAQLKHLLDHKNIKSDLVMKYLPYARQDKYVSNDATFALRPFATLLNSLNFESVSCLDPHSNAPKELIKNFINVVPYQEVEFAETMTKPDRFCYPDKGAMAKYGDLFLKDFVYGNKVRNQETGALESMELVGDVKGKSVLIVDDICDGGGTFCWMASILYDAGATDVNLYTTHGIFSKGLRPLYDAKINRIFTKDGEISSHQGRICYEK